MKYPKVIDCFDGNYGFLSNFYETPVTYGGVMYRNSEAAYQAQKDPTRQMEFVDLPANKAKRLGRKVDPVADWDDIKYNHMLQIVRRKFHQNPRLAEKLIQTGEAEIIEGNRWNDTYWGVCEGKGQNKLGNILMQIRNELKQGGKSLC